MESDRTQHCIADLSAVLFSQVRLTYKEAHSAIKGRQENNTKWANVPESRRDAIRGSGQLRRMYFVTKLSPAVTRGRCEKSGAEIFFRMEELVYQRLMDPPDIEFPPLRDQVQAHVERLLQSRGDKHTYHALALKHRGRATPEVLFWANVALGGCSDANTAALLEAGESPGSSSASSSSPPSSAWVCKRPAQIFTWEQFVLPNAFNSNGLIEGEDADGLFFESKQKLPEGLRRLSDMYGVAGHKDIRESGHDSPESKCGNNKFYHVTGKLANDKQDRSLRRELSENMSDEGYIQEAFEAVGRTERPPNMPPAVFAGVMLKRALLSQCKFLRLVLHMGCVFVELCGSVRF